MDNIEELKSQLTRKTQECEELKKQYNCYACDTCKGKEDYINLKRHCENAIKSLHKAQRELDKLKAENEELKQKNSILEDEFKILEDNLDSRTRDFENIIEQAEQKLEQIKAYATCPPDTEEEYGCKFCRNKYLNKILKVIDEV